MLVLAKEWGIGRKAVSRLLEDFSERGLIRVDSNPVTSIIDMVCVKSWMIAGRLIENPTYRQTIKAYEGVRVFLFNGQQLETLRRSSARKKKEKTDRRNGRGNRWLAVHESDPFQSYYRRNRYSGNRNGSNNRKRNGKHCGKCSRGCRRHTCLRGWQHTVRFTGMETATGMKRQEWQATMF
ncbi:hypothetical protein NIB75_27115 [Bacteroides uniformis]|nr:hypothetical protein [Bacteroides uniformis]